jgi:3-methyladenine DNA glycosylase AlkD
MEAKGDMSYARIIRTIKSGKNRTNIAGMKRFGIDIENAYGSMSIPELRALAKRTGKDHALALKLWDSGIHEARLLASLVDDPGKVTERQLEKWVLDFNSWDICDMCCSNLFDKTGFAYKKATAWSGRSEEYVKRAGYAMMAALAVHDKDAKDRAFEAFLPLIKRGSTDDRNFVKKAVNWALRQIGKRNKHLRRAALRAAYAIKRMDSRAARWIASDAIRELESRKRD